MNRPSTATEFAVEDTYIYKFKHEKDILWGKRVDGSEVVGARTMDGIRLLTGIWSRDKLTKHQGFKWVAYTLPCGSVYLIEEVRI